MEHNPIYYDKKNPVLMSAVTISGCLEAAEALNLDIEPSLKVSQIERDTYSLSLIYDYPLATGAAIGTRADFSHKDDAYQDIPNLDAAKMIEFDVINLRAAYLSEDAEWEVAAWVKNAADEEYLLHNSVLNPGLARLPLPAAPRTVGLTATWNFGE